jgi:hypothetical protein
MSYTDLLRDPRWQRRRLEVLEKASWTCSECAENLRTLHVHHLRYIKGNSPWDYDDVDLAVLCDKCHDRWHRTMKDLEFSIARMPMAAMESLAGYAALLSWWGNGFKRYPTDGCKIGGMMAFVGVSGQEGMDFVRKFCDDDGNVNIADLLTAAQFNPRFF